MTKPPTTQRTPTEAAAGDALRPTVEALQESAFDLLGRMCAAGRAEVSA